MMRRNTSAYTPPALPDLCAHCREQREAFTSVANDRGVNESICLVCYEQRRSLTLAEKAYLERRAGVPPRRELEPGADYVARAMRASQPKERADEERQGRTG